MAAPLIFTRMFFWGLVLLGLSQGGATEQEREERSLVNTFPFNGIDGEVPERDSRQGLDNSVSSIPFSDVASSYAGGKRCIDKVFMEERTEWEVVVKCEHSYNRRCAKTLKTRYEAAQEEDCQENYVKNCFIEYGQTAQNVTVTVCRTPLIKDCDKPGEEVCSTQYESECITQQEVHQVTDDVPECRTVVEEKCEENTSGYTTNTKCSNWPREECALSKKETTKFSPLTKCNKVPVELCGPAGCGFKEGPEECFERTQTVVGDKPEESCNLNPQTTCKHVTKLAPQLEEVEVCFDVPKEVCTRSEVNPRKVAQPVLKKWCYVAQCDDECKEAAAKGECLPQCETYRGNDKCCAPCPSACLSAAAAKQQCSSQCQRYSDNPKCCYSETPTTRPPPTTPRQTPRPVTTRPVTTRPVTPRPVTPRPVTPRPVTPRPVTPRPVTPRPVTPRPVTTTRRTTRPSRPTRRPTPSQTSGQLPTEAVEVEVEVCPYDCAQAFRNRETLAKCKQYKEEVDDCYYEKCSEECRSSASRGETNPDCRQHLGDKECYAPPSTCPVECQKDAALGFCSSKCKEFEGNPDCCAPTCPAKCTNKRRGECSAGGVPECGGVAGCCPERYDIVYGVGLYADEDGLLESNN